MKQLAVLALVALPAIAAAASAQQPTRQQAAARPSSGRIAIDGMRVNYEQVTANVIAAAEEISEADYAYRPVETVRTFGQLFGHVAGAQKMMCAAAMGDPAPDEDAVEKTATTKAAIVAALKESTEYCKRAYAQDPAGTAAAIQLFGQSMSRAQALALNAVHNGEHYGNIVTYMRMKGMVPPSSRR